MPSIKESDISGGSWEYAPELSSPTMRRSRLWLDEERCIVRTEVLADEALVEDNQQAFNDSHGKRWGDGQVVARVPLNVLFGGISEIAKKIKEGDSDHLKWWLNRDDAKPYRRFKGQV